MQVVRTISIFNKSDEELIKEINVDSISLERLKDIFKPTNEDPLMYYTYKISEAEAGELSKLTELDFDFSNYIYQLDCFTK